jgi:biopolymer transport protein ExbD
MTMSLGRGRRNAISSINVTPMADIMISGARLVIVEADEALPFPTVGATLLDCREAGADEVALATHPYR